MQMNSSLKELGFNALNDAHSKFLELVQEGTAHNDVGLNQFGEMAMRIDVAAEDVVLSSLKNYSQKHDQGIQIVSEEHGELTVGDNPLLTAFIDGLDGSSVFRDSKATARCGTMFSLYEGLNPKFENYLLGGITDHILGKTVLAVKGEGTQLLHGNGALPVKASNKKILDHSTKIYIDEGVQNYSDFPHPEQGYFYDPIKRDFNTLYLGSTAVYFLILLSEKRILYSSMAAKTI